MSKQIKVELGAVQETLLIPLLGRAEETRKNRGLLKDDKAVEIVETLDYDFQKWRGTKSLLGSAIRTRMFDRFVERFLREHPVGTVVEIGCGLNTRFERVDNGEVRWFDLDLPDVIGLRRQFFEDAPRRTMLAASVLETAWMDPVAATGGPWMFLSEAVLIYLDAPDAKRALHQIADRFPGARIALDTTDQAIVAGQSKHDAMRHLPPASWFRWACDNPEEVEDLGLELIESQTFVDADRDIIACLPRAMRLVVRWFPYLLLWRIRGYRLNQFVVRPTGDKTPNDKPQLNHRPEGAQA